MKSRDNYVNTSKMLSMHNKCNSRECESQEELGKNLSDRKYVNRRMFSELTDLYMDVEKDENIRIKKETYFPSLHNFVSKTKKFNSDLLISIKGEPIIVNNRLPITMSQFESCFDNLFEFISHILCISKYGIIIENVGHIYIYNNKIKINPFYQLGLGSSYSNLKITLSKKIKSNISKYRSMGQDYIKEKRILLWYKNYNKEVLHDINISNDYLEKINNKIIFS